MRHKIIYTCDCFQKNSKTNNLTQKNITTKVSK